MADTASVPTPALTPEINREDIENFLLFLAGLTGEKEIFTYCLMDLESESVIPGYGVTHGKLLQLNHTPNTTLHVCLNRTNLRGRRTENMVSARVLCCDLDREIETADLRHLISDYAPGLVVESSPKHYHLYWKVDSTLPLIVWSELQLGLAELLSGDYALRQVTHTIRVPGVLRLRAGQPVMPRIVYLDPEHQELTHAQIDDKFSGIWEAKSKAEDKIKQQNKLISKAISKTKKGTKLTPKDAAGIGRNSYLYSYLKEWITDLETAPDRDSVTAEAHLVNSSAFESPLGEQEVGLVVKKALVRGMAAREFKEEKRKERLGSLGVELEAQPVAQTGEFVNGQNGNGNNGNGAHTNGIAPGEFPYDYSVPRLKNSRLSDSGLVERVIQRFGKSLLRCGRTVYAFHERSKCWVPQAKSSEVIRAMVLKCADDVCADPVILELCSDKNGLDAAKLLKEQQKWHSHRSISGTISGTIDDEQLKRVDASIFDSNRKLFCIENGALNVESGAISEPNAEDYMLRRSPVVYDPAAKFEWWEGFLEEVFSHNQNPARDIEYLQEVFGYSLSGYMQEQRIFIHTGEGSNGKSKVIGALHAVMGDYSTRLASNSLSKSKNAVLREIERIGAKIEGKRVVIIDDLDSKTQWNEGFVKALTDEKILARRLYEEERDIPNRAKIHICCNQVPEVEVSNEAIYRRLAILEYNRVFPVDAAKGTEIEDKIKEHLSGILNWAITGFQRMLAQGGINYPESVTSRIQVYRDSNASSEDIIPQIFTEYLAQEMKALDPSEHPEHWHSIDELVQFVARLAQESGIAGYEVSKDSLGRVLSRRGFASTRKQGNRIRGTYYFVKVDTLCSII